MERTQDSHRSTMEKILRTASKNELVKEDRFYAENQLRKIYSCIKKIIYRGVVKNHERKEVFSDV
jgi:hypothetical protein